MSFSYLKEVMNITAIEFDLIERSQIDVDDFKKINDNYGHDIGNALKEVACRLKRALRSEDVLIRYGGDEFLVIVYQADKDISEKVAKRILENVSENMIPALEKIKITVSIGIFISKGKEYSFDYMAEKSR